MSAGGEKAMWRRVVTVETVEMVNWTKQGKDMRDNGRQEEEGGGAGEDLVAWWCWKQVVRLAPGCDGRTRRLDSTLA